MFLRLSRSSPAGGAAVTAEIPIVEDQRQVVGFLAVVLGGDADARAAFQGRKEGRRDAVNEPHGHAVELSASRGGLARGGGSDPRVHGV